MRLDLICFLSWIVIGVSAYKIQHDSKFYNLTTDASEGAREVLERAARIGLRASEHVVRTEDGHVLRLFRVRREGAEAGGGPPVLLMHGLLQSAGNWLDAGNVTTVALLANAGHDLCLGNVRGSHYSRRHEWLRPDIDSHYWQFSVDEIGRYDLPALFDYILTSTGAPKLDYIGYSQGSSILFILCSELPHYCDKVNVMIALAPATRLRGIKVAARLVFELWEKYEARLSKLGIWEALPQGGLVQSVSETLCNLPVWGLDICETIKNIYDSPHPGSISGSAYLAAVAASPAGTSVHNMAWYSQNIRSEHFQKFDYGPDQNIVIYGNETAPVYDLSAVTVPTVVIYARNDRLVDESNIKWLVKKLPNVVEVLEVEDPMWTHFDFSLSLNVPKYIYPTIKKYLENV